MYWKIVLLLNSSKNSFFRETPYWEIFFFLKSHFKELYHYRNSVFLKNCVVSEIFSMLNFSFRKFFRDKLSSWEIFSSLKFSFWIFSLLNFRFYRIFFFLFFYMKFRLKNIASLKFYLDRIILLLEFSSKL